MMRAKVVLVPFPYDDLSDVKPRPAVCMSEPIGKLQHVVLAFVTSQTKHEPLPTDLMLDSTHRSFAATGLRVSSTIRVHRLLVLRKTSIHRELGIISPEIWSELQDRIKRLFQL